MMDRVTATTFLLQNLKETKHAKAEGQVQREIQLFDEESKYGMTHDSHDI